MLSWLRRRRRPTRDEIVARVRKDHLSYLAASALKDLYDCVQEAETRAVPGVIVEAGCALGGSAIVMTAAKDPARELVTYDVFGMIPEPGAQDGDDVHARYDKIRSGRAKGIGGDTYYGYQEDLEAVVRKNFSRLGFPTDRNNVRLVKGLFQDTLAHDTGPVALGHVDGDWYDSVMTCLRSLTPRLSPGGRLVIDDYQHWSGCRTAVDEFLQEHPGVFETDQRTRLHLVRTEAAYVAST